MSSSAPPHTTSFTFTSSPPSSQNKGKGKGRETLLDLDLDNTDDKMDVDKEHPSFGSIFSLITGVDNNSNSNSHNIGGGDIPEIKIEESSSVEEGLETELGTNVITPGSNTTGRKLCVRHKTMADQGVNGKLQKSLDALPLSERAAITSLWSTFSSSPHPKRKLILEGLLTMCCFSQLSHIQESLHLLIRVDPFSLFPREVCLRTLGFLDAISLGKAAQVSKQWKELADDDLLWRRMCGQHIERKCTRCGWGLPLLERRRLRSELERASGNGSGSGSGSSSGGSNSGNGHGHGHGEDHHHHDHDHTDDHDHSHHHNGSGNGNGNGEASGSGSGSGSAKKKSATGKDDLAAFSILGRAAGPSTAVPALIPINIPSSSSSLTSTTTQPQAAPAGFTTASSYAIATPSTPPPSTSTSTKRPHPDTESPLQKRRKCEGDVSSSEAEMEMATTTASKALAIKNSSSLPSSTGVSSTSTSTSTSALASASDKSKAATKASIIVPGPQKKPWKAVYCERLMVERNWRKGRFEGRTLRGHSNGVMCLQFRQNLPSPNYPVLITGSYDRTAKVWNLDTGECVRTLTGHTRAIRALQFDGVMCITGSMDRTLRIWNWRTGDCVRVLEGHTDGIICLNYDKEVLASGSADSTIKIWNFKSSDCFTLRGHQEWVNSVLLWDGQTASIDDLPAPSINTAAAKTEPKKFLFSASDDGTIKFWDLIERTCLRTFTGHNGQVQSIKLIVVDRETDETSDPEPTITGHISPSASPGPTNGEGACSVPYSSNFQRDAEGASTLLDLHSGSNFHLAGNTAVGASSTNGAGRSSVSPPPGFDPLAYRKNPHAPVEAKAFVHPEEPATRPQPPAAVDEKQVLLVSGGLDNLVKVWDVETGRAKRTLFGHIEGVWAVDIDTLRLASGSHDRTIKIWDRETGRCAQTLVGHRGAVTSLQLSDDLLVSGSDDGEVKVWNFGPTA